MSWSLPISTVCHSSATYRVTSLKLPLWKRRELESRFPSSLFMLVVMTSLISTASSCWTREQYWRLLTNNTNVSYEGWSVRKEYQKEVPVLSFYLEPKQSTQADVLERVLNEHLRAISPLYEEAIGDVETNPVKVTLLQAGSFQRYYEKRQTEGADLAHLKPPHMSASNTVIQSLIQCSREKIADGAGEH